MLVRNITDNTMKERKRKEVLEQAGTDCFKGKYFKTDRKKK